MSQPRLTGVSVYLPDGQVKRYKASEVVAYGAAPTIVVAVKHGTTFTKYAGFPTVFHEEEAIVEVVSPIVGVG
jgi:hypothetical protein